MACARNAYFTAFFRRNPETSMEKAKLQRNGVEPDILAPKFSQFASKGSVSAFAREISRNNPAAPGPRGHPPDRPLCPPKPRSRRPGWYNKALYARGRRAAASA